MYKRQIEAHPAVLEAAVVALPDPRLGQVPAAAYRVKSGPVSYTPLRAHETVLDLVCRLLLAKKKPRYHHYISHHT